MQQFKRVRFDDLVWQANVLPLNHQVTGYRQDFSYPETVYLSALMNSLQCYDSTGMTQFKVLTTFQLLRLEFKSLENKS